jgi:hypothetical protein
LVFTFDLFFSFLFDLLFAGGVAFRWELLFAGTRALIVTAASQTSPIPSPSVSICVRFGIPTQLS